MRPISYPTKDVLQRALKYEFETEQKSKTLLIGPRRIMGVLIDIPFKPIHYLGTTSFVRGKISKIVTYSFTAAGPWYGGTQLKLALRILDSNRVRVFTHRRNSNGKNDPLDIVLLLGTKEGTVAIAPRLSDPAEDTRSLIGVMKHPTQKLVRAIVYAGI